MAFVGKAEYSKLKGYVELVIDLSDKTESTMVDWEVCKWALDEKSGNFYCAGKPKSISSVDASKLPDFLYVTFHSKDWEKGKNKEKIAVTDFEKWVFELAKPWIESGELLAGKMMLSPGMALNEQMVKSFIGLTSSTSNIELPVIEISTYTGSQQKSYGLSPEQKVSFLLKQLKIDDANATLIDCALVIDTLPENKATLIELIKTIL